jgi:hypothetical protein
VPVISSTGGFVCRIPMKLQQSKPRRRRQTSTLRLRKSRKSMKRSRKQSERRERVKTRGRIRKRIRRQKARTKKRISRTRRQKKTKYVF